VSRLVASKFNPKPLTVPRQYRRSGMLSQDMHTVIKELRLASVLTRVENF